MSTSAPDFAKRNVKIIGISANGLEDHHKWTKDIEEWGAQFAPTTVDFPIVHTACFPQCNDGLTTPQIADADRKISTLYDMLDEQDATNRDAKGLPFTVCLFGHRKSWLSALKCFPDPHGLRY